MSELDGLERLRRLLRARSLRAPAAAVLAGTLQDAARIADGLAATEDDEQRELVEIVRQLEREKEIETVTPESVALLEDVNRVALLVFAELERAHTALGRSGRKRRADLVRYGIAECCEYEFAYRHTGRGGRQAIAERTGRNPERVKVFLAARKRLKGRGELVDSGPVRVEIPAQPRGGGPL